MAFRDLGTDQIHRSSDIHDPNSLRAVGFLPEHTTAVSLLDRLLHHANTVVTDGESYRMRQARQRGGTKINKP